MTTGPDLRVGDADRDAAAAELREHYAQGRLSLAEFNERLAAVFVARRQNELRHIMSDLPHALSRPASPPDSASRDSRRDRGYDRRSDSARRRRLLPLPAVIAATVLCSAIAFVFLLPALWGVSIPGRFGILLAIIVFLRGLLRRLFGRPIGRRRGCGFPRGHRYGPGGWDYPGGPWQGHH